jgi:hypothetical protein
MRNDVVGGGGTANCGGILQNNHTG